MYGDCSRLFVDVIGIVLTSFMNTGDRGTTVAAYGWIDDFTRYHDSEQLLHGCWQRRSKCLPDLERDICDLFDCVVCLLSHRYRLSIDFR